MSQLRNSDVYDQQGFGQPLELVSPTGLLIVDFVNGFADPGVFGGGNVQAAIERTVDLLAMGPGARLDGRLYTRRLRRGRL